MSSDAKRVEEVLVPGVHEHPCARSKEAVVGERRPEQRRVRPALHERGAACHAVEEHAAEHDIVGAGDRLPICTISLVPSGCTCPRYQPSGFPSARLDEHLRECAAMGGAAPDVEDASETAFVVPGAEPACPRHLDDEIEELRSLERTAADRRRIGDRRADLAESARRTIHEAAHRAPEPRASARRAGVADRV